MQLFNLGTQKAVLLSLCMLEVSLQGCVVVFFFFLSFPHYQHSEKCSSLEANNNSSHSRTLQLPKDLGRDLLDCHATLVTRNNRFSVPHRKLTLFMQPIPSDFTLKKGKVGDSKFSLVLKIQYMLISVTTVVHMEQ